MTYHHASKLAGLFAIAALLGPLPRLEATDCSCPKPKVKISAIHSITPASAVKVFFDGVEVPPEAEPVEMERDREYALTITVTRVQNLSLACDQDVELTFPHCTIEYSRDEGSTWTRGTRSSITVSDDGTTFTYSPASILIRITSAASDSANGSPAAGDEANPQSTPPCYRYDNGPVLMPPGLGLEIPIGSAFTPDGYRSAGWLFNYGQVSASFAAPSGLHYNGISQVSTLVLRHDVLNGSSGITEKQYIAPQGALRVCGWNSTSQSVIDWTGAAETLVEVYEPGNYNATTHAFSGEPHSYYRLEVASGNGLQDGFRLVQSNHGKVKIRSFQASGDGLHLRDKKGFRVTDTYAIPPSGSSTTWQAQTTVTEDGDVTSSVRETYQLLQGWRNLAVERTEDPSPASGDELTTYTSYYWDGQVRSVSRPDGSWSFHTYNGNETITYSPWLSSSSLIFSDGNWSLPSSGLVVKSVSVENIIGSSTHNYLVDLAIGGTGTLMSDGSDSISTTISGHTLTTHISERGPSDNIATYSLAYADYNANRLLAGRTLMTWDGTGKATLNEYERGTWTAGSFTPDTSGTDVRASTVTGYIATPSASSTPANFTSVPAHSIKEVTITSAQGVVREETQVCNGSGTYAVALAKDHEYESGGQHRHTGVKINGVYVSKTGYVSSSLTRESDQDGTTTETETNASDDVIRTTTLGNVAVPVVTTRYRRVGLTTTTTMNGRTVSIETRDAAGRVVSSGDASGATVHTDYGSGGRVVTRTAPGGVTIVNEVHYDGQALSTTGSGVIPQYYGHTADSSGRVTTTTTTVGDVENNTRVTSTTRNRDGSTAFETSPDPAGGNDPVVRTYQYAAGSTALLRVSSSASNTAAQIQLNPATSPEAAMGHYSLSGFETDNDGPVIASSDRLTETSTSYVFSDPVWNRQTVTRIFHTVDSDDSYTRTSLEAITPGTVSTQPYGNGLRWSSSTTNGTTTVTTTRDSFFAGAASVVSTDDSATSASPDSVSISNHGRAVSNSAYGTANPETMAYDAAGRLIRHTSATGALTTYAYNTFGQLVSSTDHAGNTTTYNYYPANDPAAGLLWKTTNAKSEVVENLYNTRGQVTETKGSGTYHVTYHYNDYGEKDEMRTYRSSTATGDLTQWINYPATGLLYQKIDASSKATTYTYDSAGNVYTRVWARPGAISTTYTHNAFDDLTNVTYSDSTPAVTITPDRLGRPSQISDASGTRTQTYHSVTGGLDLVVYGNSGLLASREVQYTWDTSLRPAGYAVSNGGPASVLTYDSAGRLNTVSSYGATHTHGYMPGTGTLSSLTTTSGSSTILTRTLYHDRMQRLFGIVTVNASGTHLSRHGYTLDAAGRRIHASRENGQRWDYDYDTVGEVTSAVKKFPNATAIPGHAFSYQYDGIGNRTSATHGGTSMAVSYTPNALNQYSNITTEGGRFILGEAPATNDVFINGDTTAAERAGGLGFYWKQITGDNSAGPLWSNDSVASNGVTISGSTWTPPNSVTRVHDDDGNLTYDGRWNSVWDAENRLVRMTTTEAAAIAGVPRQRLDFVYDSQNRRVSMTVSTSTDGTTWTFASTIRCLYDGWNLIAEYSAPSETSTTLTLQAAHVWGIDLSGTPQGAGGVGGLLCSALTNDSFTTDNYFPAYDGNGNVSAWLDGSGTLLARMDYSPFGQLVAQYKYTSTSGTTLSRLHFGFSTKYTDKETGLLYYIQRYYDPVTGRWRSKDPIEEDGCLNLYGFVANDGVGGVDRIGEAVFVVTSYGRFDEKAVEGTPIEVGKTNIDKFLVKLDKISEPLFNEAREKGKVSFDKLPIKKAMSKLEYRNMVLREKTSNIENIDTPDDALKKVFLNALLEISYDTSALVAHGQWDWIDRKARTWKPTGLTIFGSGAIVKTLLVKNTISYISSYSKGKVVFVSCFKDDLSEEKAWVEPADGGVGYFVETKLDGSKVIVGCDSISFSPFHFVVKQGEFIPK